MYYKWYTFFNTLNYYKSERDEQDEGSIRYAISV